jgi:hypothetical protein
MSAEDLARNLSLKALRRLQSAHKPLVRHLRRRERAREHAAFRREVADVERELASTAADTRPIVVGPWLAEVGYEVLYWIPFLRWFVDAHGIARDRLIVVSRGGMEAMYGELAGRYVDIFDVMTPQEFVEANARRQTEREGGGRKQTGTSELEVRLLGRVMQHLSLRDIAVCSPSQLFRMFRNVWHGNLPVDVFTTHTRYATRRLDSAPLPGIPADFIAVKLYAGPALTTAEATRVAVRALIEQAARVAPVVLLETELGLDEHRDFDLRGIPNVTSAGTLMQPRTNLGVQLSLIARSRFFLGTCGGLAWVAPFLGIPTVAVYDTDAMLLPHLLLARQAGHAAGAAEFAPLDLRAIDRVGLLAGGSGAGNAQIE